MSALEMTAAPAFDVLIVGGGVLGGAVMSHLQSSGLRIGWMFPQEDRNRSATGAAGAMLGAFGEIGAATDDAKEDVEFRFRLKSQESFKDWLRTIKEVTGNDIFQTSGTFVVGNAASPTDRACLRNIFSHGERYSGRPEWVEVDDVPGLKPTERYAPVGCVYLPTEDSVSTADLQKALHGYTDICKNVTYLNDRCLSISQLGDTWAVAGQMQYYTCGNIVLSGGAGCLDLLEKELAISLNTPRLFFGKGVSAVLSTKVNFPNTIRTPNRAFACGSHVVPRENGSVYLGATNFFGTDINESLGIDVGELHILFDQGIHQINTDLRHAFVESTSVGRRPITALREPLIGMTEIAGLYLTTGTYRNGVVMAPLVGEIIADEIVTSRRNTTNPYIPRPREKASVPDLAKLIAHGAEDIAGILHEPNGVLPYERSAELRKLLSVLLEMALTDNSRHRELRREIVERLSTVPLNETLNRTYYDIIASYNR